MSIVIIIIIVVVLVCSNSSIATVVNYRPRRIRRHIHITNAHA